MEAALATVVNEGLVGASARTIARNGEFNQALVFYHFGSIEELLLEALSYANDLRMATFGQRFAEAETLADLMQTAEELLDGEHKAMNSAVVAIIGGWPAESLVGKRILGILRPWDDMVKESLQRCVSGSPLADVIPVDALTFAISSMVIGMELTRRLSRDENRAAPVLRALAAATGPESVG